MFDHFVGLVLKGLTITTQDEDYKTLVVLKAFLKYSTQTCVEFFCIFLRFLAMFYGNYGYHFILESLNIYFNVNSRARKQKSTALSCNFTIYKKS